MSGSKPTRKNMKFKNGDLIYHTRTNRKGIVLGECIMYGGPRKGKIAYPQYGGLYYVKLQDFPREEELCGDELKLLTPDMQ